MNNTLSAPNPPVEATAPKKPAMREQLLTTAAVANWLGISPRTICFWAECQEIPAVKLGRQWRFKEEEIRRWLERSSEANAVATGK